MWTEQTFKRTNLPATSALTETSWKLVLTKWDSKSEEKKTPTWAAINCFSPSTVMPLLRTPRTVGNLGSSLVEKDISSVSHAKFYLLVRLIKNFTNTATHERHSFSVFCLCELKARWEDLAEKSELLSVQNVWCSFISASPQGGKTSLGEEALILYLFNLYSLKNSQGKSYVFIMLLPFQWHLNNGTWNNRAWFFLVQEKPERDEWQWQRYLSMTFYDFTLLCKK